MRMLNDKRWMETKRIVWQRAGGLCEQCLEDGKAQGIKDGYIRSGVDCHHIIPFESAKTQAEMERLCYDPNNCRLLCIPCHVKVHQQMGSKKKEAVKARRKEGFERWKDKMKSKGNGSP